MPYKPFRLGMYAAEREMDILTQIQKHGNLRYSDIGYDKDLDLCLSADDTTRVLNDLRFMGLIRFDKDKQTYALTKKAEKFLKENPRESHQ